MSAEDGIGDGFDGGDGDGGDIGGGWGIGDDDTPLIDDRYITEFDLGAAGTLKLPHLINMAVTIMTAFVLVWFAGLNRIITGGRDLLTDFIDLAFMPVITVSQRLWTEPTAALETAWTIATASIGNDVFSFVMAVAVVTVFFLLITIIINDIILGGEEA